MIISLLLSTIQLTRAEGEDGIRHVVVSGENLYRISLRYGVAISSIMRANDLTDPSQIRAGQVLLIPRDDFILIAEHSVSLAPPPASTLENQERIVHVVRPGENLYRISLRYQSNISAILEANGMTNPNVLWVGQRLIIPSSQNGAASDAGQTNASTVSGPGLDAYAYEEDGLYRITYYCINGFMSSGR
ncbi:MAG: LysM peptidoglycan-binding domain-containing protein, partial [Chloroflexi bacterium]|nr:LysM peptidoglycan-binding domain-containing protein [Chloroflexota bacterium]